jgi:hypothetical protein
VVVRASPGGLSRRGLLSLGLAPLGAILGACGRGGGGSVRELPVQLGRAPVPTNTPHPTALPVPTPDCPVPAAQVVSYSLEGTANADARTIAGQIKTGCHLPVDVTLSVRWLDGVDRLDAPRAFAIVRRVQPGETRSFREVAPGGRGATRAELTAGVDVSRTRRR